MNDEEEMAPLQPGKVDMVQVAPPSYEGFAAVLWVPDPEQRRGWREFWVRTPPPRVKPGSRWGF